MWSLIEEGLADGFRRDARVTAELKTLEDDVAAGRTTATRAARRLLELHAGNRGTQQRTDAR